MDWYSPPPKRLRTLLCHHSNKRVAFYCSVSVCAPVSTDVFVDLLVDRKVFEDRSLAHTRHQILMKRRGLAIPTLSRVNVGNVNIQIAIVVDVAPSRAHSITRIESVRLFRHVSESAI